MPPNELAAVGEDRFVVSRGMESANESWISAGKRRPIPSLVFPSADHRLECVVGYSLFRVGDVTFR